jgi:hypothetical protein
VRANGSEKALIFQHNGIGCGGRRAAAQQILTKMSQI